MRRRGVWFSVRFGALLFGALVVACAPSQASEPEPVEEAEPPSRTVEAVDPPVAVAPPEPPAPPPLVDQPVDLTPRAKTDRPAVTEELTLTLGSHPVPDGAPNMIAHLPEGFDASGPLHVVMFLHGWQGCARVLALSGRTRCRRRDRQKTGWGLIEHHDAAGLATVFLVPQLLYKERDGSPGRFYENGFARDQVAETLTALELDPAQLQSVTLVSHSAGYETAVTILNQGEIPVRAVVLLDSLYGSRPVFERWFERDERHRIVSIFTGNGGTARENRSLARAFPSHRVDLETSEDELPIAVRNHRLVVAHSPHSHGSIPRRHLAGAIARLPIPRLR